MSEESKQDELRLGFLAAMEVPNSGYVGGLLVTNRFGRPLEFQCTAPVRPNRTQEILYGPTLRPFLLGELIGKTLVERVDVKPHLVLTEQQDLLELRNHISIPVALIDEESIAAHPQPSPLLEAAPEAPANSVRIGRHALRFHQAHQQDREAVQQATRRVSNEVDLSEPFDRIREALNETLQAGAVR
ncbi:MAG: hypothetical protein IH899_07675 [Planctomycetes bacterium]|nr:hypothetical protein [Planctomycetota bacterium]